VLDELLKSGARVGGEQSGHIILPGESLVGDGLRTSLRVLRAMSDEGRSLDSLVGGFESYPQTLVNVSVREKIPFDENRRIAEAAGAAEEKLNGRGRLLLRYSGTESLARVMIEGEDQAEIELMAGRIAEVIAEEIGAS
jgi:phosphoglucosamine mutase